MTIRQFNKLPAGSRVSWNMPGDAYCVGIVRKHAEDDIPSRIDWDDGQCTDGRDDAALQYVVADPQDAHVSGEPESGMERARR